MIYSYITVDIRQRALQVIDLRRDTNKIAAILGVSAKSIGWWEGVRNYATHGVVNPTSPLCCRPRKHVDRGGTPSAYQRNFITFLQWHQWMVGSHARHKYFHFTLAWYIIFKVLLSLAEWWDELQPSMTMHIKLSGFWMLWTTTFPSRVSSLMSQARTITHG